MAASAADVAVDNSRIVQRLRLDSDVLGWVPDRNDVLGGMADVKRRDVAGAQRLVRDNHGLLGWMPDDDLVVRMDVLRRVPDRDLSLRRVAGVRGVGYRGDRQDEDADGGREGHDLAAPVLGEQPRKRRLETPKRRKQPPLVLAQAVCVGDLVLRGLLTGKAADGTLFVFRSMGVASRASVGARGLAVTKCMVARAARDLWAA
eukprot:CAMPEP_0179322104 /NCGR_PEP_ID=MMETSP0797-20121207/58993_1 /TAXON_ID=47934 /ORGANISM="Dinophysis acuminata, Strain DAEP01" /LENGTH=202 /DNA_ID=CAMNT_0021033825 /DNA_START=105 /DNA_END=712 /DNA_ORIENTATION=+